MYRESENDHVTFDSSLLKSLYHRCRQVKGQVTQSCMGSNRAAIQCMHVFRYELKSVKVVESFYVETHLTDLGVNLISANLVHWLPVGTYQYILHFISNFPYRYILDR